MKNEFSLQSNFKKWAMFFSIGLGIPLLLISVYAFVEQNKKTLPFFGNVDSTQKSHYQVPNFNFLDQDSTLFYSASKLKGKITVIHSFFTSCGSICPKMISNDRLIIEQFKNDPDLMIVSFTVDPERDTPYRLKQYAANLNLPLNHWKLLTGSKKELYLFARKSLFISVADGNGLGDEEDFIHSEQAVLLDNDQHIRGYFDLSSQEGTAQLIKAIKTLKN